VDHVLLHFTSSEFKILSYLSIRVVENDFIQFLTKVKRVQRASAISQLQSPTATEKSARYDDPHPPSLKDRYRMVFILYHFSLFDLVTNLEFGDVRSRLFSPASEPSAHAGDLQHRV
jgi:hypothetical protein